ncbi:hypothetical protein HZ992_12225 [Rhizobacter sp. AJA081-3]|uniref:hypothetical protein n=1 Tax=Rhizobacter sp. AJA081-3 TaxID=2753607 RepID=UPI001AE084D8|nr:hypothetical protein [Rhizobacter sp. AJA081-3]QTN25665.1 hypothetical protein HZ992_12225 [Rhizobacter sp. AJA081-3]
MSAATIDFLHPRRTPWLGWVLLVAGTGALVLSLWADQRWTAQRAEFEAAKRQREEATQTARALADRPVPLTPQDLRMRAVAPQLRQPWLPLLRVVENVTEPPIFLLAMTVDPVTGSVRLDGEAPGFAEALAYSQALRNDDVLAHAQLRSHDVVADPNSSRQAVRFSIAAEWIAK